MIFIKDKKLSDPPFLSDNDKIEAIRSRDEFAIGKIFTLYKKEFLYTLKKQSYRGSDAIEDIYTDAFCTLCNKVYSNQINETTLTSSLKTYLIGIGKKMLMAHERKRMNNPNVLVSELPDMEDEDFSTDIDNVRIVEKAVNDIGEPCHSLLRKKYWDDLNGDEIASEMHYKNADTVKNMRSRCIRVLKDSLRNKIVFD